MRGKSDARTCSWEITARSRFPKASTESYGNCMTYETKSDKYDDFKDGGLETIELHCALFLPRFPSPAVVAFSSGLSRVTRKILSLDKCVFGVCAD